MRHHLALLPVLLATLVGAPPAPAWTWPADGPVLQPFHFGDDPYVAGLHRGVDVAGLRDSPVHAPASGTVTFAGTVPGGGRTVTIVTADGLAVTLVHLGSVGVRRGASVAEGATVGTIGPSGDAEHSIPYVHLGVRVADDPQGYLDPLAFLPAREPAAVEPTPPVAVPEPSADPPLPAGEAAVEAPPSTQPEAPPTGEPVAVPVEADAVEQATASEGASRAESETSQVEVADLTGVAAFSGYVPVVPAARTTEGRVSRDVRRHTAQQDGHTPARSVERRSGASPHAQPSKPARKEAIAPVSSYRIARPHGTRPDPSQVALAPATRGPVGSRAAPAPPRMERATAPATVASPPASPDSDLAGLVVGAVALLVAVAIAARRVARVPARREPEPVGPGRAARRAPRSAEAVLLLDGRSREPIVPAVPRVAAAREPVAPDTSATAECAGEIAWTEAERAGWPWIDADRACRPRPQPGRRLRTGPRHRRERVAASRRGASRPVRRQAVPTRASR